MLKSYTNPIAQRMHMFSILFYVHVKHDALHLSLTKRPRHFDGGI